MLDIVQPSSKGRSTWFVRKDPDAPHLFVGDDSSHEMIWPDIDGAEAQKWLLYMGIRAQTAPRNSSEKANAFTESMHYLVVIWEMRTDRLLVRIADPFEVNPSTNARS